MRGIGQDRYGNLADTAPDRGVVDDDPVQRVLVREFLPVGIHLVEEFLQSRPRKGLTEGGACAIEAPRVEFGQDRPDREAPVTR